MNDWSPQSHIQKFGTHIFSFLVPVQVTAFHSSKTLDPFDDVALFGLSWVRHRGQYQSEIAVSPFKSEIEVLHRNTNLLSRRSNILASRLAGARVGNRKGTDRITKGECDIKKENGVLLCGYSDTGLWCCADSI